MTALRDPDQNPAGTGIAAASAERAEGRLPVWVVAVLATVAVQTATAFMIRVIPTLGPVLAERARVDESVVGYLASANTAGSIIFLIAGAPLMRRFGPLRSLQIGIALAAVGALMLAVPSVTVAFVACLLMGLGYGPSAPAGTDILHRFAPTRHRALVFSVKQAGVPLGGVLAGLILPALAAIDVRVALLVAALTVIVIAALVQPAREVADAGRERGQSVAASAFFSIDNVTAPVRAVFATRMLPRLAFAGTGFAVAQGSLLAFQVTYFVTELGMSLALAGSLSALMHVTGIFGRVLLGWVSDRLGSGIVTLRLLAVASAGTMAAFAMTGVGSPLSHLVFLSALAGVTVMSWNGVILAEMARRSPPGTISAIASGATMLTFLGYVGGPAGFASVLWLTESWRLCFALIAVCVAAALALLFRMDARAASLDD